jgi:hypothetical protein
MPISNETRDMALQKKGRPSTFTRIDGEPLPIVVVQGHDTEL